LLLLTNSFQVQTLKPQPWLDDNGAPITYLLLRLRVCQNQNGAPADSTGAPFCAALKAAALHLNLEASSWLGTSRPCAYRASRMHLRDRRALSGLVHAAHAAATAARWAFLVLFLDVRDQSFGREH
jgi:hypothetical protein